MKECKHALGGKINEVGETLCFCELTDNLENVTLGDCLGNCESQEKSDISTTAIEFFQKAKAICDGKQKCLKCPMGALCFRPLSDINEADLVRKVMAYQLPKEGINES